MKIKRWALLTALLYGITFFVLTGPVVLLCFYESSSPPTWTEIQEFYSEVFSSWQYGLGLFLLIALQAGFLLAPLEIARQRPVGRARWFWLAGTAGLLMALLIAAAGVVFMETTRLNLPDEALWFVPGAAFISWLGFGLLFYYGARPGADAHNLSNVIDQLISGSVAELLIAVPCHVYVRGQKYCCAGFGTFIGIAAGLSVMLFAFGPGVFFLFVKRARKLQPAGGNEPTEPQPDLHAGIANLNPDTRDAGIWAAAATAILLIPALMHALKQTIAPEFMIMGRLSFIVMGCVALYHGARGYRTLERRQRWLLFAGAALVEAVALVVWSSFA